MGQKDNSQSLGLYAFMQCSWVDTWSLDGRQEPIRNNNARPNSTNKLFRCLFAGRIPSYLGGDPRHYEACKSQRALSGATSTTSNGRARRQLCPGNDASVMLLCVISSASTTRVQNQQPHLPRVTNEQAGSGSWARPKLFLPSLLFLTFSFPGLDRSDDPFLVLVCSSMTSIRS